MYLCENRTCAQVQEYLEENDFHVNTRQIKNRLNEWKFECKKTRADQYLAMLYVADFHAAEGYDVIFSVPKREERENYSTRKVRKECDRIRKKRDPDRSLSEPNTLDEAEKILIDADIKWKQTADPSSSQRSRQPFPASPGSSLRDSAMGTRRASSTDDMCSSSDSKRVSTDTDSETALPPNSTSVQPKRSSPRGFPRQRFSLRQHKLNAGKWVEPYYTQCFETPVSNEVFERHRRRAMQVLESILRQDNQYIFPTLAEMVMIFGSNHRATELAEFLADSCTVIDACPGLRGSFTYDAPFRYALAFTTNNPHMMREYGLQLKRSMAEIRQIWGEEHPNYLVNANFCAWHFIHNRDYHLAVPLLRHCLPICERVMGLTSLVTINCLVITSRAHAEIRNDVWAKNSLELAMSRIDEQRHDLEQFRLVLLHRLAELNLKTGDFQTTEMQFWRVLQDRAEVCGLDAEATWSAAQSLRDLFLKTGREDHAEDLMNYMHARLDWERRCIEKGEESAQCPQPPWWWPYGTEDSAHDFVFPGTSRL
ncbi:hypothetical protein A1O3_07299 [Capronia epimyces CBS 606.96]|uniref:Clr5 domain-containing protein n=1 Tax=Capronia epimyces CBS 606.96 TaxID=1182542 RepID=W9XVI6_9EURO|nr:uncharacterized protein A1O3_07299 [Capronia epimyces CBS 606.96]EXJ81011.1 hypothetical protein A1O3_07299 [Capronia epimyces CBS 606.96]